MPGVRLHHPTHRSCTFLAEDVTRPYRVPVTCPVCSAAHGAPVQHHVKTYHLDLDSEGDVIVSETVFARLKTMPGLAGLFPKNEVAKPPDLVIGMNGTGQRFGNFHIVKHEFNN